MKYLLALVLVAQPFQFVEVKGADLPEWSVWEQAFFFLNNLEGKKGTQGTKLLEPLKPEERKVLMGEARLIPSRHSGLNKRLEDTLQPMVDQGKKSEDIMPFYKQIHLQYRTEILSARDRIMRKISRPESEFALDEFLELVRGVLVYRVDKIEYESGFYKQPQ